METSKGEFIFDFNCDDLPEDPEHQENGTRFDSLNQRQFSNN